MVYSGAEEIPLSPEVQRISVNLVRMCGALALEGHYLVEMTSASVFTTREHFVSSGKQFIPLAGCEKLTPGDVIGTATAPLIEVPIDEVVPLDKG